MATTVIQNSCVAGAMAGLMTGRYVGSFTPTDYSTIANAARAIADELITENTASGSPMADADNPQIDELVKSVATATIINSGATSITPADYINYAKQIYAACKQGLTKLITSIPTPAPIPLLTAANYAILSKSGITNVPTSHINGAMAVSPIAATAITGFSLVLDAGGTFSTSAQVTGHVYAADYTAPTPATLTQAVLDMEAAYTNAAGAAPNYTEYHGGLLDGDVLTQGVYKWSTGVTISGDITLDGDGSSVFIFEIAGNLSVAVSKHIILNGAVSAANVFWQVAGNVAVGGDTEFNGVILCATDITLGANVRMHGQCLSQTAVNLNSVTLN